MTKPVAKSLHTITVIVQVARTFMVLNRAAPDHALDAAMVCLGLDGRADPYGLKEAARKQLTKGA